MNEEQRKIMDAAYNFKLKHGRYEYLKRKRNELEIQQRELNEYLDEIKLEMDKIQFNDNGYRELVNAILEAEFEDLK